nr:IS1595 family transposase [Pararcticibacter amylolyticus]
MTCPHEGCEGDECYVFKDGIRYKCKSCNRIYTARTGTVFESSKIPLARWFIAIYLIMHKRGISSVQLAKDIGVTQKTAWFVLHRLRSVLANEPAEQLSGVVEIDETFVGGKSRFRHKDKRVKYNPGRGWIDKTPVLGMLQRGGKVKASVIPNVLMLTIQKQMLIHVRGGSDVMGDGFNGYRALNKHYELQCCDHGKGIYGIGEVHTNGIENFWSHFKRHIGGTHIKVSRKHLDKYVQESVFRYNYRNLGIQEQFETIVSNMGCRLKYKDLIA